MTPQFSSFVIAMLAFTHLPKILVKLKSFYDRQNPLIFHMKVQNDWCLNINNGLLVEESLFSHTLDRHARVAVTTAVRERNRQTLTLIYRSV